MIDADERTLMEETVRSAIADALAADEGADIDAVLARLDWRQMLDDAPGDAIDIVFNALGATNATATALDDVLQSALGQKPRADLAVLLPGFAAWDPPGRIDADDLRARSLATVRAATAGEMLVVGGTRWEPWSVTIPMTSAERSAVHGIDPKAGFQSVRVQGRAGGATRLDPAAWESAVALGRRAVAHQIAGASRAMLELACTHAKERVQFGRPIARFQAVRHRLADALVAVEALDATLDAAREEPKPETAALAKAVAGRTARTVATHCQQVLAGIGFTTEHPLHRYVRRTLVLDQLLGSAGTLSRRLGDEVLRHRALPEPIPL